jgi:hypothetical protein
LGALTSTEAQFAGGPRLTGYAFEPAVIRPGDAAVLLTLQWTTTALIPKDYTIFTHLLDASGQLVAQSDSEPASGTRPTRSWKIGDVIVDHYALSLPPDLPAGDYRLNIGVYDWRTGERLQVGEADYLQLGTLQVMP